MDLCHSEVHCHINTLPPEILSEIFKNCLAPRNGLFLIPSIRKAPMLLCQVCSYWRELALSLPMLWSSFAGSRGHDIQVARGHVSLIQLWLERSRTEPLFLYFNLRKREPLGSRIMGFFLDNIHRWEDVTFVVDDDSAKDLSAIPGGSAHLLNRFAINADRCTTKSMDEISPIFSSFPNLRRLWWRSRSAPMALLGMSFSSLSHIKLLCPVPFNQCVSFMAQCSQICEVEISDVQPSPVPFTRTPPIVTLPHLSSLNISVGMSELLDYFTLPSLRLLVFGQIRLQNFKNLAARSSCKLETFYLIDKKATEEELIYYLRSPCLQSLRTLQINSRGMTDQILTALRYSVDPEANLKGNILPHLEIFSIGNCQTTDGVFSDMVASRWRPHRGRKDEDLPPSLKEIDFSFFPTEKRHGLDHLRLQEFAANGLKIWEW